MYSSKIQKKTPKRSMWKILKFLKRRETQKAKKNAQEWYQHLTEEEKEESHNKNLSEKQKKKLAEYRRNYYLAHKK